MATTPLCAARCPDGRNADQHRGVQDRVVLLSCWPYCLAPYLARSAATRRVAVQKSHQQWHGKSQKHQPPGSQHVARQSQLHRRFRAVRTFENSSRRMLSHQPPPWKTASAFSPSGQLSRQTKFHFDSTVRSVLQVFYLMPKPGFAFAQPPCAGTLAHAVITVSDEHEFREFRVCGIDAL